MVIVIIGVLAAVAVPKMVDTSSWRLRAYSDDLVSQGLAARRLALSQRQVVVATITPGGVRFDYLSGSAIAVLDCPAAVGNCIAESGSRSVSFNAGHSGSTLTSSGGAMTITVTDGANYNRAIRVETETGLFLAPS